MVFHAKQTILAFYAMKGMGEDVTFKVLVRYDGFSEYVIV